jgi:hypothetical protein
MCPPLPPVSAVKSEVCETSVQNMMPHKEIIDYACTCTGEKGGDTRPLIIAHWWGELLGRLSL